MCSRGCAVGSGLDSVGAAICPGQSSPVHADLGSLCAGGPDLRTPLCAGGSDLPGGEGLGPRAPPALQTGPRLVPTVTPCAGPVQALRFLLRLGRPCWVEGSPQTSLAARVGVIYLFISWPVSCGRRWPGQPRSSRSSLCVPTWRHRACLSVGAGEGETGGVDWPTMPRCCRTGLGRGAGLPSCCPQVTAPPHAHASSRRAGLQVSAVWILCRVCV